MEDHHSWVDDDGFAHILYRDETVGVDGVHIYYRTGPKVLKRYLLDVDDVPWGEWPGWVLELVRLPVGLHPGDGMRMRADEEQFNANALVKTDKHLQHDGLACFYADELRACRERGESIWEFYDMN